MRFALRIAAARLQAGNAQRRESAVERARKAFDLERA
jgi:hypothetical protein